MPTPRNRLGYLLYRIALVVLFLAVILYFERLGLWVIPILIGIGAMVSYAVFRYRQQ